MAQDVIEFQGLVVLVTHVLEFCSNDMLDENFEYRFLASHCREIERSQYVSL